MKTHGGKFAVLTLSGCGQMLSACLMSCMMYASGTHTTLKGRWCSHHLGQVTGLLRLLTEHVASSPRPDAGTTVLEHCQVQLECLQVSLSVAARSEPRLPRNHG